MKTTALIEKGKDGTYGIFTPDINSTIIGSGDTVAEAKEDFENSIKEIIEFYKEDCIELPEELKDIEFEYKWDIASLFNFFNWINVSKFAEAIGIAPSLMRYYKKKGAYISDMQAQRIEAGLHRLADELRAISL